MTTEVESGQEKLVIKKLKKIWKNPDNIKAEYSNDMTVNHTEQEFFISFFSKILYSK